jgi:hypothetical protein
MPEWAVLLLGSVLGFLGGLVTTWMRVRHERETRAREVERERDIRAQDAASLLLARLDGVIDAVGYALLSVASGERDEGAIRNAIWLSGELSTEVARSLLSLPEGAGSVASEAFDELRSAALILRVHLGPGADATAKPEELSRAQAGYDKARELRLGLIESLRASF